MTRKSYDQLNDNLSYCRRIVKKLSTDPDYGITTLQAAPYELASMIEQDYHPAFITLVSFRKPIGPDFTYQIKRICGHRDPNVVMRVRLSDHEILFFTERDPSDLIVAMQKSITKENLQASAHFLPISGDFESDARTLQSVILAKKNGYQA